MACSAMRETTVYRSLSMVPLTSSRITPSSSTIDWTKNYKTVLQRSSESPFDVPVLVLYHELKFRTKQDKQQSFVIHNKYWNSCTFEPKHKKDGTPRIENALTFIKQMKAKEPLPDQIKYDSDGQTWKLSVFHNHLK